MLRAIVILMLCSCAEPETKIKAVRETVTVTVYETVYEAVVPKTVTVLGDSTARDWPPLLQGLRDDIYVIDHAVSGSKSNVILNDQWLHCAKPMAKPDMLVVLGGVVDFFLNDTHGVAYYNLNQIYTDAIAMGIDVYAITTLPSEAQYTAKILALNDMLRARADITVIDLYAEFDAHRGDWFTDSTHHNALGLARIAEAVADVLPVPE